MSLHFNRFCTHCDYFRKLAPSNEPLRYRTKPSRDFLSHSRSPASHTYCLFRLQVPIRLFKIFFFALIGLFDKFYFTFTTRNRNGTQSPSILHPTCNFAIEGDYRITLIILHFHRFLLMRRLWWRPARTPKNFFHTDTQLQQQRGLTNPGESYWSWFVLILKTKRWQQQESEEQKVRHWVVDKLRVGMFV